MSRAARTVRLVAYSRTLTPRVCVFTDFQPASDSVSAYSVTPMMPSLHRRRPPLPHRPRAASRVPGRSPWRRGILNRPICRWEKGLRKRFTGEMGRKKWVKATGKARRKTRGRVGMVHRRRWGSILEYLTRTSIGSWVQSSLFPFPLLSLLFSSRRRTPPACQAVR